MDSRIDVLDHGFVLLIEAWGSDERVIEGARMSTGKGFLGWGPKGWICTTGGCEFKTDCGHDGDRCPKCDFTLRPVPGDERLLRFLWENKHSTPFELGGATFEIQAPIFVFREWHRHRTQSYSELSARYTPLPDVNYIPSVERLMLGSDGKNKQAGTIKDAAVLTESSAESFRIALRKSYEAAEALYREALEGGIPKELARVHLPVGRYSRMRASANLRNWLAFLTLRCAPGAQWEIRQFAHAVSSIIKAKFPRTWELWYESAPVEKP